MSKNDVIRQLVGALKEQPRKTYESGPYDIDVPVYHTELRDKAIAAGEAELAKPEPEPVGYVREYAIEHLSSTSLHTVINATPQTDSDIALYTTTPEPAIQERTEILREALREIALAGMSRAIGMSDEETEHWHARRAFEFIGIAARALDAYKAMLSSAPDYKG